MKKVWRCFVCNDIHPEVCPTCRVKNAYVEISPQEAKKICGAALSGEFTRQDFRKAIEAFADNNEFRINPNEKKVNLLFDGIFENEQNHGLKYCPCRLKSKDFQEDMKIICPCNFLVHETYKGKDRGECWCGLFVKR
jgi:ferredoxin-thioredoxin reductase catalytic subunit